MYLFAADGSKVYLSLNQGTERVRGGRKPIAERAPDIRDAVRSAQAQLVAKEIVTILNPVIRSTLGCPPQHLICRETCAVTAPR